MTVPVVKMPIARGPMLWSLDGWSLRIEKPFTRDGEIAVFNEWIGLIRGTLSRQVARRIEPMVDGDLWHQETAVMHPGDIGEAT